MKTALISVSDKTNIVSIVNYLLKNDYQILSTGGTYHKLISEFENIENFVSKIHDISSYINHPEILDGRVKTLHPKIYGGILAKRDNQSHISELNNHQILTIDIVIVNLYPFKEACNNPKYTPDDIIENIDIGGHTLIRASAKNYKDVLVITNPNDYNDVIDNYHNFTVTDRRFYATKAFNHVTIYDAYISNYFQKIYKLDNKENVCPDVLVSVYEKQRQLKYGVNPQQKSAALYKNISTNYSYPFTVLNGNPGYINVLDAIYSWNLVEELDKALGLPAAASFKHNSPAGAAVYSPLDEKMRKVYNIDPNRELSKTSIAFIRARNADPMCSYGDFIAISGTVFEDTARLISAEVSDGIIAIDYMDDALEILRKKKSGNYIILKANSILYNDREIKELHGITLVQDSNQATTGYINLNNVVTENKELSEDKKRDMILANTTLKYTQSNSVAFAYNGQCIGIGAGQQSRIDCVKLAKRKTETWYLRQHPKCIALYDKFKSGVKRQQKVNAIVRYIEGDFTTHEYQNWSKLFTEKIDVLTSEEKHKFLKTLDGVVLASDGYLPFYDNIDVASQIGVKYIVQPGGSVADSTVIEAANEYGMTMAMTGAEMRMFLH